MNVSKLFFCALILLIFTPAYSKAKEALTLEDRIEAQKKIEQVYYKHRIWPKENNSPKPTFNEKISESSIETKTLDSLKKSVALERNWNRKISTEMLQAEIDRMANTTKDASTLRELFSALGNNAFLIAETLGRQTLADRLIRNSYAFDQRFHNSKKELALSILKQSSQVSWTHLPGNYSKVRIEPESGQKVSTKPGVESLSKEEFEQTKKRYSKTAEVNFQENSDGYLLTRITDQSENYIELESLNIPKVSFTQWWEENSQTISAKNFPATGNNYKLPTISEISDCEGWEDVMNMNGTPAARFNHTAIWTGTEMIVWGGGNGAYLNSGGRYNPATDTWTHTSTGANVPFPRELQTAIWTGSEMIIWGGWNGAPISSGARYDPVSDTWTPISSFSEPSARYFHSAIWTGQSMIVWGGTINNNPTVQDTGGIYNPSTDTWQLTSITGTPAPRMFHTAVWTGTEMLVWGGYDGFLSSFDDGARYNPQSDSWSPISQTNSPIARNRHTAVWTGSKMIIWGGEYFQCNPGCDYFYLNDGGRYDPVSDTWTATSVNFPVPDPRSSTASIWTGNKMIIWGGGGSTIPPFNSGGEYDPVTNTWSDIAATSLDARRDHAVVWTGSEMIVWGGYGGPIFLTEPLANGARYNPSSDTWVGISFDNNIPLSHSFHSAIWTGAEMIVWGGGGSSPGLNTGSRYDPALNNWTPTSTGANVPDGRYSHTAIWTGSEMIIWGGYSGFQNSFLNTGGRYDPISDSWNPTSIGSNVPSPRYYHTAIWSGSEMIIWGGTFSGPIVFNDGGRYDPLGDSWLPTSTGLNVPLARSGHTVIWTGQEMIIWGGLDQNLNLFNSGGRYDPAVDAWSSTSVTDVPIARAGHTAIWDGNEMIIWGGGSASGPFPVNENSGGIYDPSSDSWHATSISGVPYARNSHSAIWSGSEMIIWGGSVIGLGNTNTGGRYDPLTDSWKSMTINSNTPQVRYGHTAIWTGTKMVIWGGGSYIDPASGGSYSPDTELITVTPFSLPDCQVGVPYNQQIAATGGTPPYSFYVAAGGLPYGLTLDPLTGIISGIPSASQTSLFTITSADLNGCAGSQSYSVTSISCNMFVIPTTLPDGQLGVNYDQTITVIGGNAPFTFSISSGALPAGLSLDATTGVISGTPTFIELATFTLTVTDSQGCVFNQPYAINITGDCDLSVSPTTLPDGVVGIDYNQTITASGGTEPYTFSISSGALPAGLTLDSATGVISGIPTTVEAASFTLTVTDAVGCTLNQPYTINIVADCDLSVSPTTLPDGQVGVDYNQTITASGGTEPYTFSISAGALPAGLALDSATGVISGTPTTVELATFTLTVTDSQDCVLDQPYTINIVAAACLFCDDFEDNVLDPNWTVVKQAWNEAGGFVVGSPTGRKAIIIATPIFQGCQICFEESSVMTAGGPGNRIWLLGWYIDKKNTMELLIKEENDKIILKQRVNGSIVAKAKGIATILPNTEYVVRVSFDGTVFTVTVDGAALFTLIPVGTVPTGTIGFQVKKTTGSFGYILVD